MNTATHEFTRWGADHLGALAAVLLVTAAVILLGKGRDEAGRHRLCRALALVLALEFVLEYVVRQCVSDFGPWRENLPLHFCSVMMLISSAALWWRQQWACAFVYFGVLAASVQGLITPALSDGFPSIVYLFFFASHGLLFVAAITIPVVLGWRACGRDIVRCMLLGNLYLLCIIPINLWLGTNYGFTQHGPAEGSLLDYLGPAPWYYLWLQVPALLIFWLMSFAVRQKHHCAPNVPA